MRALVLVLCAACGGVAPSVSPDGTTMSSSPDAQPAAPVKYATGVRIDDVAVFQAVKVSLTAATRNAPILAGRDAAIRVYVSPTDGASHAVTGELVTDAGVIAQAPITIAKVSTDDDPTSVLTFSVPAVKISTTTALQVRLVADDGVADAADARFPHDGSLLPLGAVTPGTIRVTLVPLRYNTDGSGRLPDTSTARLDLFRTVLLALYPLADVQFTVHDPVDWNDSLTFTGNVNFSSVNDMLINLRSTDNAPDDAYYYALVVPADTFDDYCGGSCVTGQSYVVDDPTSADTRVGGGVAFPGEDAAWTLAHELGHEHGRYHAPCSAGSPDPAFPYSGGGIGVWGWDDRSQTFVDPSANADFMGYCDPAWVSDYTYEALYERILAVHAPAGTKKVRARLYHPDTMTWGPIVRVAPGTERIRLSDGGGDVVVVPF